MTIPRHSGSTRITIHRAMIDYDPYALGSHICFFSLGRREYDAQSNRSWIVYDTLQFESHDPWEKGQIKKKKKERKRHSSYHHDSSLALSGGLLGRL
jgi:hypothetical protein